MFLHQRAIRSAVIGAAITLTVAGCLLTHRGLSGQARMLVLPGLTEAVSLERDEAGIPHIHAGNRRDLARALGYVQAQDRLFQIELGIRLAEGRLAEVMPIAKLIDPRIDTFRRPRARPASTARGAIQNCISRRGGSRTKGGIRRH